MSTKLETADHRCLLAAITHERTGRPATLCQRWQEIGAVLIECPLETSKIAVKLGRDPKKKQTWVNLHEGERVGIFTMQRQYGKSKERNAGGQLDAKWSLNLAGLRKVSDQKPASTVTLDDLPTKVRSRIFGADFTKLPGLNRHWGWRVRELCVVGYKYPVFKWQHIAAGLDVSRAEAYKIRTAAEVAGVCEPDSLANHYRVIWATLDSVFDRALLSNPLGPVRSLKALSELTPGVDRRSKEQRQWCQNVDSVWQKTGLKEQRHWWEAERILQIIGASSRSTQGAIAAEIPADPRSVQKAIDRMEETELLAVTTGVGRRAEETDFVPNWGKLEFIGADSPRAKPKRQAKAADRQTPSTNDDAPEALKVPGIPGPQGEYWHLNKWLVDELKEGDSKPYDLRKRYTFANPLRPLPTLRSFSGLVSKARKKARSQRATVSE